MRQTIEEKLLRLVRLYTFNTPIKKGKYRLYQTALRFCKYPHSSLSVRIGDGRRFVANLTTGMQEGVFFLGEYEAVLTKIAGALVSEGDVCIDVGTNFGWYTSLMAMRIGPTGAIHAFEPMPQSFDELKQNYELMGSPPNVVLNNLALGDQCGTVQIHMFAGLTSGHASLAAKASIDSTTFDCKLITLDSYLIENAIDRVDFVKVDIEGAELMFLKGAERLFKQDVPPIFMMEMAVGQTVNFDYHPNELIEFIGERGDYEFFEVDEQMSAMRPIDGFAAGHIGANVFCIPRSVDGKKRSSISEYLGK
jgi:FkbM family methyltransferase